MENKLDTIGRLNEFLRSSKNESEFFGLDKTGYISMEEYLEKLRYLYDLYFLSIKEPFMSLTKKNRWVKDVQPNFNYFSDHVFDVIDYKGNTIPILKEYGTYTCIPNSSRREQKLIRNSAQEIWEIDQITKRYEFDNIKKNEETLSNNFLVSMRNFTNPIIKMNLKFLIPEKFSYEDVENLLVDNYIIYATYLIQNRKIAANKEQLVKKLYLKK